MEKRQGTISFFCDARGVEKRQGTTSHRPTISFSFHYLRRFTTCIFPHRHTTPYRCTRFTSSSMYRMCITISFSFHFFLLQGKFACKNVHRSKTCGGEHRRNEMMWKNGKGERGDIGCITNTCISLTPVSFGYMHFFNAELPCY